MKNPTWQNPEQLFVAQELINKVKSKCCGIKANSEFYHQHFGIIENKEIILPEEHIPNPDFLEYHLCNIFAKHN